jgi:hypothetical protein
LALVGVACVGPSEPDVPEVDDAFRGGVEPTENEVSLDVGSNPGSSGPIGNEGGPVSLPVALNWTGVDASSDADDLDGTVQLQLTNLRASTISARLVALRSSGVERSVSELANVVVDAEGSVVVDVELLPEDVELGNVASSMNLRVEAIVVDGSDVDDEAATLGHYQPRPLFFHARAEGGYRVYGEAAKKETYAGGLVAADALVDGNVVEVPEGVELQAVVIGAED